MYISRHSEEIIELYKNNYSLRAIAKKYECNSSTILKILKKNNIERRNNLEWMKNNTIRLNAIEKTILKRKGVATPKCRKYNININLFKNIDIDKFESYLYGVIVTDGSVADRSISLMVSNTDIEWMKNITKLIGVPLKIDNRGYPYFNINSVEIVKTLNSLGINKNKTKYPKDIIIPSKTTEADFLRGLIDGDGSIYFSKQNKPIINFGNTNKQLVNFVCSIFNKFGSKCNVNNSYTQKHNIIAKKPYKNNFYTVNCCGKTAKLFLEYVYYNDCFGLPRKIERAKIGLQWQHLK